MRALLIGLFLAGTLWLLTAGLSVELRLKSPLLRRVDRQLTEALQTALE